MKFPFVYQIKSVETCTARIYLHFPLEYTNMDDFSDLSFYEIDFESENRMIWEVMVSCLGSFTYIKLPRIRAIKLCLYAFGVS